MKSIFQGAVNTARSFGFSAQLHWGVTTSGVPIGAGYDQLDNFVSALGKFKKTISNEDSEARVIFGMSMLATLKGMPNSWMDFVEVLKSAKDTSDDFSEELFRGDEIEKKSLYRIHSVCNDLIFATEATDQKLIKLLDRLTGPQVTLGHMLSLFPADTEVTITFNNSTHTLKI